MTTIRGFSHTEVWLRALKDAYNGRRVAPRGMETFELPWVQLEVYDPMTFPLSVKGRDFRDVIGVLEGLSLVGETSVPEAFTDRISKFGNYMDGGIMWGAYGARTHGQLGDVVSLLERDPDTRQAVMSFYDAKRDLNRDKKDIPCTISGQFLLRGGPEDSRVLELGISMRSNDLWLGTPYDFVQFSVLQASVAQALGARVGRYVHRAGSLHLYERDYPKATGLGFRGDPPMRFPLWNPDVINDFETATDKMMAIQKRARRLLVDREHIVAATPFELWARDLLSE